MQSRISPLYWRLQQWWLSRRKPRFVIIDQHWPQQYRYLRYILTYGPCRASALFLEDGANPTGEPPQVCSQAMWNLRRAKFIRVRLWDAKLTLTRKGRRLVTLDHVLLTFISDDD